MALPSDQLSRSYSQFVNTLRRPTKGNEPEQRRGPRPARDFYTPKPEKADTLALDEETPYVRSDSRKGVEDDRRTKRQRKQAKELPQRDRATSAEKQNNTRRESEVQREEEVRRLMSPREELEQLYLLLLRLMTR